jgi:hypothetical protein
MKKAYPGMTTLNQQFVREIQDGVLSGHISAVLFCFLDEQA